MNAKGWDQLVDEPMKSRLVRARALITATYSVLVISALGVTTIAALGISDRSGLYWFAIVVTLILAYLTPLSLIGLGRLRREVEARLSDAGFIFRGTPHVWSPTRFRKWLEDNGLDVQSVRAALASN